MESLDYNIHISSFVSKYSINKGDREISFIRGFVYEFPLQLVFVLQEKEMELGHR